MYSPHLVATQNPSALETTLSAVPMAPCRAKRGSKNAPPPPNAMQIPPLYQDKCSAISQRRDERAEANRSRVGLPAPIHVNTEPHFPVTNWAVGGAAVERSRHQGSGRHGRGDEILRTPMFTPSADNEGSVARRYLVAQVISVYPRL